MSANQIVIPVSFVLVEPYSRHFEFLGASSSNAKFFFLPLRILLNIPYCKRTCTGAPDVYTFFCQERIGN